MSDNIGVNLIQSAQVRKDRQQAKVVLKEFRDHLDELDKDKGKILDCRSEVLSNHFAKAETNLSKARTVDQACVDAQIFRKLGEYSRRQAAQFQPGLKTYNENTFIDALIIASQKSNRNVVRENEDAPIAMNFEEIGRGVRDLWKTVPIVDFMHGNSPTESVRTVQQQRRKAATLVKKGLIVTKPRELACEEVEQTESDKQIQLMKNELKGLGKINFWEFVVDPDEENGYTRTIENLFHLSFLIKEMYAILDLRCQPPILEYRNPHDAQPRTNGEPKFELIVPFDIKTWTAVIHKYNVHSCLFSPMKRTTPGSDAVDEDREGLEPMVDEMGES